MQSIQSTFYSTAVSYKSAEVTAAAGPNEHLNLFALNKGTQTFLCKVLVQGKACTVLACLRTSCVKWSTCSGFFIFYKIVQTWRLNTQTTKLEVDILLIATDLFVKEKTKPFGDFAHLLIAVKLTLCWCISSEIWISWYIETLKRNSVTCCSIISSSCCGV